MNKQQYHEYLRSAAWKTKRQEKLIEAGWKCTQCGSGAAGVELDVHHLTYDRIGNERKSDLQVLCRICHEATHQKGFIPEKTITDEEIENKIVAQVAETLGMNLEDARAYVRGFSS